MTDRLLHPLMPLDRSIGLLVLVLSVNSSVQFQNLIFSYFVSNLKQNVSLISDSRVLVLPFSPLLP